MVTESWLDLSVQRHKCIKLTRIKELERMEEQLKVFFQNWL